MVHRILKYCAVTLDKERRLFEAYKWLPKA